MEVLDWLCWSERQFYCFVFCFTQFKYQESFQLVLFIVKFTVDQTPQHVRAVVSHVYIYVLA